MLRAIFANSLSKDYSLWKCLLWWCNVSCYECWVTSDFDSSNNPSWKVQWSLLWSKRTERNRTEKKFKTAYFLSILSSSVVFWSLCNAGIPPPPRPLVKANPIHDRSVTNVHCVSNGCCLDRRDYDTYWTDKDTFDVA